MLSPETLAADIVHAVQAGGSFLAEEHTVDHLRREFWFPGAPWSRQALGLWESEDRLAMTDRLLREYRILNPPPPAPLAPDLARELDHIVVRAKDIFR